MAAVPGPAPAPSASVAGDAAPVIHVHRLCKYYRVYQKQPGLLGSLRGLVRRTYREVRAVEDVSFDIYAGELVGFLGPNGAGKTTTLKVLSGLLYPTSGRVSVLGYDPWKRQPEFQRQFSLVLGQKNQLWWDLPAIETFVLNKEIYGVPDGQFRRTLDELVELLDLERTLYVQVRKLSLGERMKCELAAALLHSPRVLFLDEPTIGLDVVMQQRIRDFIKEYNRRHGATILLTSHYMDDVKELCRRVIIINHGRLIYDGRLDEIVRRYADWKVLLAVFEQPVERARLEEFGEVVSYEPLQAAIRVPRSEIAARTGRLLAELPVLDVTIQETEVEDVIRRIFGGTADADAAAPASAGAT